MRTSPRFALFVVVILVQLAMVAATPIRSMRIRAQGTEISLQLAPVDPYDLLTGYSMDLSYRIANPKSYRQQSPEPKQGQTVYALLEKHGLVYDPVKLSDKMPSSLGANQIVLRGVYETRGWHSQAWFGVEKLYIPEADREKISSAVQGLQGTATAPEGGMELTAEQARADLKVDRDGNGSLLRLHVGDKVYQ